jgi:ABC-2 type transport system ATP-binding protein
MAGWAIDAKGLTRAFGDKLAVQGVSFRVAYGEVFSLLGPNGAGKTTTMRMLCCLLRPNDGTAEVGGIDILRDPLKVREQIGLLPENPGLYESLSAERNLRFYGEIYGVPSDKLQKRIEEILKLLDIWDRRDDKIAKFSKGMRQKIAIARAIVHEPRILFLDEPTASLDPEASMVVRDFILQLKARGGTILLNTHNLYEAQRLSDHVGIINARLLAFGSPHDLADKMWTKATVVTLRRVDESVLAAVRALDFVKNVDVENGQMIVSLGDPDSDNPALAKALVGAGAEVVSMKEREHTLEDIYLKLVKGDKGA